MTARISTPSERLGDRVRHQLAVQARSHQELGDHLGMSVDAVRRCLNGSVPFTAGEVAAVAQFLGVRVDQLTIGLEE
ncbi:helix-turn-helix domain-containing protein [Phytoactinopolyspora alkaliphila]|uniref:Helix-turn-helix domain-containing protein n=1 Tax=Phytoactinopolyspora alkaliphila TaxID=1783498 RepID=A0A6N9YNF7_9ACTN|nr:helix-turn-helix domain-containing protein [Phytoactinopolyspora alkaliphila]NED96477.1 helix-turn-helix domain-containing protein [Phytoactinopolyspora alkaliphila]